MRVYFNAFDRLLMMAEIIHPTPNTSGTAANGTGLVLVLTVFSPSKTTLDSPAAGTGVAPRSAKSSGMDAVAAGA